MTEKNTAKLLIVHTGVYEFQLEVLRLNCFKVTWHEKFESWWVHTTNAVVYSSVSMKD